MSIPPITSNLLLEASVNYRFNDFGVRYLALAYRRHQILGTSIHTKGLKEANRYASSVSALGFLASNTSKWRIIPSTCRYHCPCLNARLRTEIRERFHLSYFVFVLTTNENRMHAQGFAGESALLSCKRTRYPCISQPPKSSFYISIQTQAP